MQQVADGFSGGAGPVPFLGRRIGEIIIGAIIRLQHHLDLGVMDYYDYGYDYNYNYNYNNYYYYYYDYHV